MLLPMLADTVEVVAVELQGHGRTSTSFDRSATRAWAADTAALLHALGIASA
jgi:pimeloyl-ACP methyl ester carboxylesterase